MGMVIADLYPWTVLDLMEAGLADESAFVEILDISRVGLGPVEYNSRRDDYIFVCAVEFEFLFPYHDCP